MRIVALALCTGLAVACGAPDPPPNIVLVIGDDHAYRDFGFMGSAVAQTPALDRLAAGGVVFTHGFTADSACRASLAAILTGLYPIQWDTLRAELAVREGDAEIAKGRAMRTVDTLPRLLAQRGYASFQAGKYWEGDPRDAGFDAGTGNAPRIGRDTLEPVLAFVEQHREGPFFLWYAPMLPHVPHDAPSEFAARYADAPLEPRVRAYLANVSWFDAGVGALVERLYALGLRERTLVVYLADNGWDTGPGLAERGGVMRSFLGGPKGKGSLNELGYRTPILFHWPGRLPAGARSDALVSAIDLLPTLLDFAGAPLPSNRPGASLRPALEGRAEAVREVLVGSRSGGSVGFFVRGPRWHYLRYRDRPAELYDVERDPDETDDRAAAEPEVIARSEEAIRSWTQRVLAQRVGEHPLPPR